MRLAIVRHGEAQAFTGGATDAARQLTPAGGADVDRLGGWLAERDIGVWRIIASPYVRAQQTAVRLAVQLGYDNGIETEPCLQPDTRPAAAIERIAAVGADTVLLVSHQPLVGRLLKLLVSGDDLPVFAPACCAVVEADVMAAGCASLISFTRPEDT